MAVHSMFENLPQELEEARLAAEAAAKVATEKARIAKEELEALKNSGGNVTIKDEKISYFFQWNRYFKMDIRKQGVRE